MLAKSSATQKASGQLSLLAPLSRFAGDHILTQWPPAAACAGMSKSNQERQMKADAAGVPFANTGALLYLSPFLIVALPTCVHRLPCHSLPSSTYLSPPTGGIFCLEKSPSHTDILDTLSHAPVYAPLRRGPILRGWHFARRGVQGGLSCRDELPAVGQTGRVAGCRDGRQPEGRPGGRDVVA